MVFDEEKALFFYKKKVLKNYRKTSDLNHRNGKCMMLIKTIEWKQLNENN